MPNKKNIWLAIASWYQEIVDILSTENVASHNCSGIAVLMHIYVYLKLIIRYRPFYKSIFLKSNFRVMMVFFLCY